MFWYMYTLSGIAGFLVVVIILLILFIIYLKLTAGKCKSKVSLVGKTAIVTGGNTGIGYETAVDFARRGGKVILGCRNQKYGEEAKARIIKETNNTNVYFKQLDVSSFQSVRQFAQDIIKSEVRLDIMVNNAGALDLPPKITEEGILLLMQTNHFGPFLLTNLLLDLIKETPNSRIVNLSSIAGKYARDFDVNNLNYVPRDGMVKDMSVYSRTKLCNILFTIELAKRLKNTSVTTYSVHPGAVLTSIFNNRPILASTCSRTIARLFLKSPREGAQTTIYCSVAEGIEKHSGQHFHDCHVVTRYKTARDPELPEKLWIVTENLLNSNNV